MTILSVRELERPDWDEDDEGHLNTTRVFEVVSDTHTEERPTILAHGSIPARYAAHPEKAYAFCRSRSADLRPDFDNIWLVVCRYTTKRPTEQDDTNPLSLKVKGSGRTQAKQVPAYYDGLGQPMVNSAGDLIPVTRNQSVMVVGAVANVAALPDWVYYLAETVNNADVTILGKVWPAGTCYLDNISWPDEPAVSTDGVVYYPLSYDIKIDRDGYWGLYPNRGVNELVYQTRASSTAAWVDDTYANYTAKTPTTDRRIIKRKILTTEGQDAGDTWLDARGQAQRVVDLVTTTLSSGAMTAGSATLTVASGLSDASHRGALVIVPGAGPNGRQLETNIVSVASGTTATLARTANTTVSGKTIYLPGARFLQTFVPILADWSAVPMPNNQP